MSAQPELAELVRRLEQVENALADAQARVPALRAEVGAIRRTFAQLAVEPPGADQPAGALLGALDSS